MQRKREEVEATVSRYAREIRELEAQERTGDPGAFRDMEELRAVIDLQYRWMDEDEDLLASMEVSPYGPETDRGGLVGQAGY